MIRLASSEVHATNGKRSGPTSKPRWLRTALLEHPEKIDSDYAQIVAITFSDKPLS